MRYILGVDGGNTKTDYFLFDENINFIDFYRGTTCSHEALKDSFAGSYRVMKEVFDFFLTRNKLTPEDISASAFGLAGVDIPMQKERLEEVIKKLGFKNFVVVNDCFLPIKAGTEKGIGVCSINGTGTSAGGIDKNQNYLQVGGIGGIVGDEAGGSHISRKVIRAAFDELYRFGDKTTLTPIVIKLLNITDKYYLMEAISEIFITRKVNYTDFTIACFEEAAKGDKVAQRIICDMAEQLARSAGGAVVNLNLGDDPEVVLAGSVWVKGAWDGLIKEFTKKINSYTNRICNVKVLTVPPATGAIIWAYELLNNEFPTIEIREQIIKTVENHLNSLK